MTATPAAQLFARKFHSIGACPEGREWILAGNHSDFRATWRVCPAAEFLSWVSTRLLGLEGTRASVACARAAAQQHKDPLLEPGLALCDVVVEGRSKELPKDLARLQEHAYDCTAAALEGRPSQEALMALSYAEYAIVFAVQASQTVDAEAKKQMILKAAQHASDACIRAWEALPGRNAGLAQIVRDAVKEDNLVRVWHSLPSPPPSSSSPVKS